MKVLKKGHAGKCFVHICNICHEQITSVRASGGCESEKIGENIHICSHCCANPGILTKKDREKALQYVEIYDVIKDTKNIASLSYWPRTSDGTPMSFGEIFAIALP
ncbi:MAG: hypothetical protein CR972_03735 [Candidatus Moraniibacteriota bacterium]|nr:MAG: hypothetical protein CR972_03735 [Candidatus Moranbacteria bacterium]